MAQTVGGQVGPTLAGDNTYPPLRMGRLGDVIVSELHGRFYEQAVRGTLYSAGSGATALSANTVTQSATSTPIVGVWNPPTSGMNLVILQIAAQVYINTLTTPVGCGPLVIASSVGNSAISTGASPFNRKTLILAGSIAKAFNGTVALTGLTNALVIIEGADLSNTTSLTHGTISAVSEQFSVGGVYNVDGSIVVPPGGVLALYNTTSTTTCSVASRMLWEEVPQ